MKKLMTTSIVLTLASLVSAIAYPVFAESPYPTPKDGKERYRREGSSCASGYIGKGDKCEALHEDTPRAYPKIKGASCPSGTFASGDACKEFR